MSEANIVGEWSERNDLVTHSFVSFVCGISRSRLPEQSESVETVKERMRNTVIDFKMMDSLA